MKKFLTVLLIIAVICTFSISSAFAAANDTLDADTYAVANVSKVYEEVAKAEAQVGADVERLETTALNAMFAGKTSKEFGAGKLVVTSDQVKAYYDSEVVNKVKAQASKEASDIYGAIQAALNDKADYIKIVSNKADAGKATSAAGEVVYSVYVGFTNAIDATAAQAGTAVSDADFDAVFDGTDGTAGKSKSQDIAKEAFAQAVTDKLAEIAAISEEGYVTKDQDAVKDLKAKASKQVSQLGNAVANGTFAFSAVSDAAAAAPADLDANLSGTTTGFAGLLKEIYVPAVNEASASGLLATELGKLTLSANEPTEAAKLAWAKTQMMTKFEDAIKIAYDGRVEQANKDLLNESLKGSKANQATIDAANDTIANAKEQKDAALEIATYLVNKCDDYKKLINVADPFASSTPKFGTVDTTYWNYDGNAIASPLIGPAPKYFYGDLVKVVGYVKDVKEEAEELKASIEIDGTTAVDIDSLLEKAIDKIYKTGERQPLPAYTSNEVLHSKQHALTGVDCFGDATGATTVKVNSKEYKVVDQWDQTVYEAARLKEVKAIKKETKAAIMAAETVADAEAAFLEGLKKYEAVLTTSDKAMNQAAKEFVDLKAKYVAQLTAELNYAIAGINAEKANNAPTTTAYVGNLTTDLGKAYTTDELTAKFNELSAEVKALKSKTTLDAEKKALEERCKAYSNKTVTVADKEDLVALRKDVAAFRAYSARLGAGYVVADYGLDSKLTAVANIEKKAVEDAYKVINKDGKATLDEAKAVAELRAALDAYNDGWDAVEDELETGATFSVATLTLANMAKFEEDIFDAEVDNVESMVAKLPANGSDAAAVKAAREAYDELTLCQKTAVRDKYYDKLVDCEKIVGRNVESLKIKASSKAKKGSITVKWKVTGDDSAVTYYEIRKSTKLKKGFGNKPYFKTTKKTYKNTKGLKKGTRYYYKVRAVAIIDGVKYTSDWSNKAYRVAK